MLYIICIICINAYVHSISGTNCRRLTVQITGASYKMYLLQAAFVYKSNVNSGCV